MKEYQFSFEKLETWQAARVLATSVYKLTTKLPADEKYSLTQQIRRSALSICANLAEGTTRTSPKDQAHFTTISYSSMMELLNHLIIATDLGYINNVELNEIKVQIQPISVKLSKLKQSQLSKLGVMKTIVLLIFFGSLFQQLQPLNF